MSFTITRAQRSVLFFLSASGYIAWCAGLDSRLEAQTVATPPARALASLPQQPLLRVSSIIQRDPFAEEKPDAAPDSIVGAEDGATAVPDATLADDGPNVPNIADLPVGDVSSSRTLVLKATIVGPNPVAYVRDESGMEIVRVGDFLAGRRVRHIDLQGIALSDGSRLDLPGTFVATPPPETGGPPNVVVPISDLRRLLAAQQAGNGVPATSGPQAAPTSAITPGYPSPGPLPTVDQRGIPVGVSPTPDVNDPTAFPYPYPYAPQR